MTDIYGRAVGLLPECYGESRENKQKRIAQEKYNKLPQYEKDYIDAKARVEDAQKDVDIELRCQKDREASLEEARSKFDELSATNNQRKKRTGIEAIMGEPNNELESARIHFEYCKSAVKVGNDTLIPETRERLRRAQIALDEKIKIRNGILGQRGTERSERQRSERATTAGTTDALHTLGRSLFGWRNQTENSPSGNANKAQRPQGRILRQR